MALYATNRFAGDGTTTQYEINFVGQYIDRSHVKAYRVDDATQVRTHVTIAPGQWLNATTITGFAPTPVGQTLVIYRDTPKPPAVDFVNGARFTEYNMDLVARQGLFVAMEAMDAGGPEARQQLMDALAVATSLVADATAAVSDATQAALEAAASAADAAGYATQAEAARAAAVAARNAAQASAGNAATSATNAATSATNAGNSATAAAGSASAASTSASNAATSASTASAQAGLAGGYATSANTQATNAATSATNAGNSATAAANSASAASTSAGNAATSATNAANSASTANTRANEANTSATNAATSATNASNSASAASTSANNAAASATTANTRASAAATSATNAAASATAAATSAANAATSEANAANSATDAETAQVAAEAAKSAAAASAALAASYVDPVNPNWNDPKVDTLNGGSLAGFRNVIINGDMKVRQREVQSVTLPADGTPLFTADRWKAGKYSTQTVLFEHVPTGNLVGRARDCIQCRSTTVYGNLATDYTLIEYCVEGFEAIRLRGATFTLSFLVKATSPGTYTVAFRNAAGGRVYLAPYTVTNSNVWQPVTITVTGGTPSGDADGAGGTQWDVTNGVGLRLSWIVNGGSTYSSPLVNQWISESKAVAQGQTQGLQANGDTFAITEVQLEVGPKRTPFERRHMSVELALCKRYFEVVSIAGGTRGQTGGSVFVAHTPYAVQKRGASVLTPRAPLLNDLTQPPTFNEVATISAYGILRSSSTNEFYYFGLVEADSEL